MKSGGQDVLRDKAYFEIMQGSNPALLFSPSPFSLFSLFKIFVVVVLLLFCFFPLLLRRRMRTTAAWARGSSSMRWACLYLADKKLSFAPPLYAPALLPHPRPRLFLSLFRPVVFFCFCHHSFFQLFLFFFLHCHVSPCVVVTAGTPCRPHQATTRSDRRSLRASRSMCLAPPRRWSSPPPTRGLQTCKYLMQPSQHHKLRD